MVVDHVEDDLEPDGVHRADHHLELLNGVLRDAVVAIARLGGEETQSVVSPVVLEPVFDQVAVVEMEVNR